MTSYRGYAIRTDGRIKRGAYLQATSPDEAHLAAEELCEDDVKRVEIWADARKVADFDCHEPGEGSEDASASSASAS
jgi:hypothetical protein